MISLAQKRQLSAALKRLHGDAWSDEIRPTYDERQLANLKVTSFSDRDAIAEIVGHPVFWLEIELPKNSDLDEIREAIPLLIEGTAKHLEFLLVDYIHDITAKDEDALRDALPQSGSFLKKLPKIDRVTFNRVNFSDEHLKALCSNQTLTNIDIRHGDITKRCVESLQQCKKLESLILEKCIAIAPADEDWFRSQLPHVQILRIM